MIDMECREKRKNVCTLSSLVTSFAFSYMLYRCGTESHIRTWNAEVTSLTWQRFTVCLCHSSIKMGSSWLKVRTMSSIGAVTVWRKNILFPLSWLASDLACVCPWHRVHRSSFIGNMLSKWQLFQLCFAVKLSGCGPPIWDPEVALPAVFCLSDGTGRPRGAKPTFTLSS